MTEQTLICDRCGKPIQPEPPERSPKAWLMRIRFPMKVKPPKHGKIWFPKNYKWETPGWYNDICGDCIVDFWKWWDEGKGEEQ